MSNARNTFARTKRKYWRARRDIAEKNRQATTTRFLKRRRRDYVLREYRIIFGLKRVRLDDICYINVSRESRLRASTARER